MIIVVKQVLGYSDRVVMAYYILMFQGIKASMLINFFLFFQLYLVRVIEPRRTENLSGLEGNIAVVKFSSKHS